MTKSEALTKVPAVTLGFWIIKILATTLGETGGDTVSMSWLGETTPDAGQAGLNGYLVGTAIFGVVLLALIWAQIRTVRFNPGSIGQRSLPRRPRAPRLPTSAPVRSGSAILAVPCCCLAVCWDRC